MAQQLAADNPHLKSEFSCADSFVQLFKKDPKLVPKVKEVAPLLDTLHREFSQHSPEDRKAVGDYLSGIGFADAIYTCYSNMTRLSWSSMAYMFFPEKDDMLFLISMRKTCASYTDVSSLYCEKVTESGMLDYFVHDLKEMQEVAIIPGQDMSVNAEDGSHAGFLLFEHRRVSALDKFFETALVTVHNCSRNSGTIPARLRLEMATMAGLYRVGSIYMKTWMLLLLANILDEDHNMFLTADPGIFQFLLDMVDRAWQDASHKCYGFSAEELIQGLGRLAKIDSNKKLIKKKGAVRILMKVLKKGSDAEKGKAAQCIWELEFGNDNRKTGCFTLFENISMCRIFH